MAATFAARPFAHPLPRYLIASVIALAADMAAFLGLMALGIGATRAAAVAYGFGIVVHWLASSRAVFADAVAKSGPDRTRQKALFVGSAMVGLAVTTATVSGLALLGADPRVAKGIAVIASFGVTWALRQRIVFARPTRV